MKITLDIIAIIGFILLFISPKNFWHALKGYQKVGFILLLVAGIIIICLAIFSGVGAAGQGFNDSPFH